MNGTFLKSSKFIAFVCLLGLTGCLENGFDSATVAESSSVSTLVPGTKNPGSTSGSIPVSNDPATGTGKILKMSGLDSSLTDLCLPLRLSLLNAGGESITASNVISYAFNIATSHSVDFFSDQNCSNPLTSGEQILNIGEKQKEIFYKFNTGGSAETGAISVSATDTSTGDAVTVDDLMTQIQNNTSPYELVIFASGPVPGSCYSYSIEYCDASDGTGELVNSDIDVQINLSSPFDEVLFYDDAACTHQVTSTTMGAGNGSAFGYYKLNPAKTFTTSQSAWMRASATYQGVLTDTPQTVITAFHF